MVDGVMSRSVLVSDVWMMMVQGVGG